MNGDRVRTNDSCIPVDPKIMSAIHVTGGHDGTGTVAGSGTGVPDTDYRTWEDGISNDIVDIASLTPFMVHAEKLLLGKGSCGPPYALEDHAHDKIAHHTNNCSKGSEAHTFGVINCPAIAMGDAHCIGETLNDEMVTIISSDMSTK